jgi:multicomponent Na+:H+ antiporter subunit E
MTAPVFRAAWLFGFWLILTRFDLAAAPAGMLATVIATRTSLRLLPPGQWRLRHVALGRLVLRFLYQSIGAGIDVAWRALDPRLPLLPGFVVYKPRLPPGPARNAFCTITSLLPGTLPCGPAESGGIAIHCLDASQPVLAQLAAEEALLSEALGGPSTDG